MQFSGAVECQETSTEEKKLLKVHKPRLVPSPPDTWSIPHIKPIPRIFQDISSWFSSQLRSLGGTETHTCR